MKKMLWIALVTVSGFILDAWEIKLSDAPSKAEQKMAAELQSYFSKTVKSFKIDGKELEAIHIGDTAWTISKGIKSADMAPESWLIRSDENKLILTGGGQRGIVYAVYKFLEDVIGIRYFSPDNEYLPIARDFSFERLDKNGKPYLGWRCLYRGGNFKKTGRYYANFLLNDYNTKDAAEYGGGINYIPSFLHNMVSYYMPQDKYFVEHPEYYALSKGKRQATQLCLSNKNMRNEFKKRLKFLLEQADKHAEESDRPKPTIINIAQEDNRAMCQCDTCNEFAAKHNHSGLLIDFLNEISAEVVQVDSSYQLRTYAYTYSVKPPVGIKAAPNIIVILCDTHGTNHLTGESVMFPDLLKRWSELVEQIHIHEYEILFQHYPECPWASEFYYPEKFRLWADHKATGANIEIEDYFSSDMPDLKAYLLSRLLENPRLSNREYAEIMKDFYDKYYGAAGPDILKYRQTLKQLSDQAGSRISWMCSKHAGHFRYIKLNDMLSLQKLFDEAAKKVKNNLVIAKRIGRARLSLDWQLGFELFRDYLRDWEQIHPGTPFPLDLQMVRERVMENYEPGLRNPEFGKRGQFGRSLYVLDEKITGISESPRFKDKRHHDIASFEIQTLFQKDAEAETGGAAYEINAKPGFGVYDVMNKRNFSGMTYPIFDKKKIKGSGYHWYLVGNGLLSNEGVGCNLIMSSSWASSVSLAHLSGIDYSKPVEFWVRFKVEGPAYGIPNESGKDILFIDRVVIINSNNPDLIKREAAKLCGSKKHNEAIIKYIEAARKQNGADQYRTVCMAGTCARLHLQSRQMSGELVQEINDPAYAMAYRIYLGQWTSPRDLLKVGENENLETLPPETRSLSFLIRGNAFLRLRNIERAETDLNNVLQNATDKNNEYFQALQLLGDLYTEQKNDSAKGETYYRQCIKEGGSRFPVSISTVKLGNLLGRTGRIDEALQLLDETKLKGVYAAQALAGKADIYQRQGKISEAISILEKAMNIAPSYYKKELAKKLESLKALL